jgi:hypothetical protein
MFGDEISIHKAVVTTKSQLSPFIKMPAIYKPYTAHLDIQLRRCGDYHWQGEDGGDYSHLLAYQHIKQNTLYLLGLTTSQLDKPRARN